MRFELAFKGRVHKDGNSAAVYVPANIMREGNSGRGYRIGETLDFYVKRSKIQRGGQDGRAERD